DLVGSVLQVAAHDGDKGFWDRLHTAAKQAQERTDRGQILGAMGAFRDPKLLEANFAVALSDEFDPRESMGLIWGATGERHMRQLVYDFLKQNFDKVVARMPKDSAAFLPFIANGFCDEVHKADVEAFFKERTTKFSGGPRVLAQVLEQISLCSAFR